MKKDYFLGISEEGFHRVAFLEWGNEGEQNLPIICVHGLTRNGHDFDSLARYLSERGYHLFCPDIIGRGDSDWLKNHLHYTYEQYVADMTALIARSKAQQVDWLGTSMGGIIGMFMASLPNTPIRRLILNDVGAQVPMKGITRLAKYAGKDPVFTSLEAAKQYFKKIYSEFGNLPETEWQELTENSIREIEPGKFVTKLDSAVKQASMKSRLAWKFLFNPHKALEGTFFDLDLWDIWQKVSCPVLIIHGEQSDILLPSTIEKMQSIHPNTEVISVADVGHAPTLHSLTTQESILNWLHKNR